MSIDILLKILFGSIITIVSWDVIRRNVKDEIDNKGKGFKRNPLALFGFGLVIGIGVLILGLVELFR